MERDENDISHRSRFCNVFDVEKEFGIPKDSNEVNFMLKIDNNSNFKRMDEFKKYMKDETSDEGLERFHELPILCRCKIMRMLPPLYKAWTLHSLPEFRPLLEESQSWSRGTFTELLRSIMNLEPGYYFQKDTWFKHGILLSGLNPGTQDCWTKHGISSLIRNPQTVVFSIFRVKKCYFHHNYNGNHSYMNNDFPLNVIGFAKNLANEYIHYDKYDFARYLLPGIGYFHLNRKTHQILWMDGTFKETRGENEKEISFELFPGKDITFSPSGKNVLVHIVDRRKGKNREYMLEPNNMWKTVFQIIFKLTGGKLFVYGSYKFTREKLKCHVLRSFKSDETFG